MKNLICPVSSDRVNENTVRLTALWTVLLLSVFLLVPNPFIPVYLAFDFYLRAFTKARYSPLSWISGRVVKRLRLGLHPIDKAPKIFAARIGLVFSILISISLLAGFTSTAVILAMVLVLFAFLECGVNFCAGCWVYTYMVIPFFRDRR